MKDNFHKEKNHKKVFFFHQTKLKIKLKFSFLTVETINITTNEILRIKRIFCYEANMKIKYNKIQFDKS